MQDRERRETLRRFLKECRARLTPDDVGLLSKGRRRVPGLRREEVAELSGISLAWYTRLETARDITVSPRLIHRLAAVLRLSDEEKQELFSLAIDGLPLPPRPDFASVEACGRSYFELARFLRRSFLAASNQELADLTTDLLFDLGKPVEDAFFVSADFESREFVFLAQRNAPHFQPIPLKPFDFSSVHDSEEVLVRGGLSTVNDVADREHAVFAPRARAFGAGRFISKGLRTRPLNGAIGYFQFRSDPFTELDVRLVCLVADILHAALSSRP
jgi:transcriptional regulator with XRE-family HTH domain